MVPRVSKTGHSFKGAALYYLNDKDKRREDGRDAWQALHDELGDRVAHVEAMNLPTDDAVQAIRHMIDTAEHADQLKAEAGLSNAGRKGGKPVYAYSLAWHPTETPTMAEQVQAAKDTLKELGIADRQALIVAHNDTDHPHVHVIVNRVCPETGRMATMSNDRLKLSQWAEAYEKERGQVFCKDREANNARRQDGFVKDKSFTRQEWIEWKKGQTGAVWAEYRQDRDSAREGRKGQYEALWRQKEGRFAARKGEIKNLFKPIWRDVFKRQRQDLRDYDRKLGIRLAHARRMQGSSVINMFRAMVNDQGNRAEFIRMQERERMQIANHQKQNIRDASREVTKAWKYDRDQLKALHQAQDKERLDKTKAKTDAMWKDRRHPTATEKEKAQQAFDKKVDRRKDDNKAVRSSLEAYYGDDKEGLEKARERKRRRAERKKRERKRNRGRGGRTMT